MTPSQRWRRLAEKARADERQAAGEMARWRGELARLEAQLKQLEAFCHEYRQRFQEEGQSGLDGRQLQGYRAFMAQLESAIHKQRERINQLERAIEAQRLEWERCRRHAQVLDSLVQRHLHRERLLEEGREQAEADDRPRRRS